MKRLLLILLFATTLRADLTVSQYVDHLQRIQNHLDQKQLERAKTEANALLKEKVAGFRADGPLLLEIANAKDIDPHLQLRLQATIDELRAAQPQRANADKELLKRVAAEEQVPEFAPGGEIPTKLNKDVPLIERIAETIERAYKWLAEKIGRLLDWILDLLPSRRGAGGATAGLTPLVIVMVSLIALVLLVLAIQVTRNSKRSAQIAGVTSEPIGSSRDEDPLSRGATEWERYAAQLAASGRLREAIRAWYHAVLVTSYSAGLLHYRKGRTNWEYVAMLAPSTPWRPDFIDFTRRFEQEWYGSDRSSEEAFDECSGHATRILDAIRRPVRGAA